MRKPIDAQGTCDNCGCFIYNKPTDIEVFAWCWDCGYAQLKHEEIFSDRYDDFDDPIFQDEKAREDFLNMK